MFSRYVAHVISGFEIVPVAPIITAITFVFTFYMYCKHYYYYYWRTRRVIKMWNFRYLFLVILLNNEDAFGLYNSGVRFSWEPGKRLKYSSV